MAGTMTPSRLALLTVLQRTRAVNVAKTCGVHKSRVSRWATGEDVPSTEARARMAQRYGIPVDGWEPSTVYKI